MRGHGRVRVLRNWSVVCTVRGGQVYRRSSGIRLLLWVSRLRREFDEPKGVEVLVEPFTVHQFGMGTGFHKAPFVKDEDAIRSLDGRQAVGNHKGRSAFHKLFQRFLNESLRLTVEG